MSPSGGDDAALEEELDSLLYQNDTENIEDLFGTLKVNSETPKEDEPKESDPETQKTHDDAL